MWRCDRYWSARLGTFGLGLLVALGTVGCGANEDGLNRQGVSGIVRLDGKPIRSGTIAFDVDEPRDQRTFAGTGGAVILHGQFSIDQAHGLSPGKYRVSITSEQEGDSTDNPRHSEGRDEATQPVPEIYNAHTELRIEIGDSGESWFEFDLTSK